jgi:hypothetical protein
MVEILHKGVPNNPDVALDTAVNFLLKYATPGTTPEELSLLLKKFLPQTPEVQARLDSLYLQAVKEARETASKQGRTALVTKLAQLETDLQESTPQRLRQFESQAKRIKKDVISGFKPTHQLFKQMRPQSTTSASEGDDLPPFMKRNR